MEGPGVGLGPGCGGLLLGTPRGDDSMVEGYFWGVSVGSVALCTCIPTTCLLTNANGEHQVLKY